VLGAQQLLTHDTAALIVGFGGYREWLAALAMALRRDDRGALAWLREAGSMPIDAATTTQRLRPVIFTGRLDHRYAPGALAAMTVMVVPSILREAFGMVAAEAASAGALPVVAGHSGLAEVADALESAVGRPGLFSFAPGEGAVQRLAMSIDRILSLPAPERDELRAGVHAFVAREWTWQQTAMTILAAW
jgi:glycosyltransferase involved in cell wall biosynthesis